MPSTFETFLTDCQLGGLSLGDSKVSVVSRMGTPDWWYGKGTLSYDESDIWAYDDVEIMFMNDRAARLAIAFDRNQLEHVPKLPSQFEDGNVPVSSATTDDDFVKYLSEKGISFETQVGSLGTVYIKLDSGAVAVFEPKVDHDRSIAEERRVASEQKFLYGIYVEEQADG